MFTSKKANVVLLSALSFASPAVLALEFAIEGKLQDIVEAESTITDANGVQTKVYVPTQLKCNGTTIKITPTTEFTTPTGVIPAHMVTSKVRFPGMLADPIKSPSTKSAFMNGTCIIEGDSAGAGAGLVNTASAVFLEVAENVLVGATTNVQGQLPFEIMGVTIVMLDQGIDPEGRIIALKPTNGFGQQIDLKTVPQGDLATAEGYYGDDGKFYAHVVETSLGAPEVGPVNPEATIQRGDATYVGPTQIKLEVRGGCVFVGPPLASGAARTMALALAIDRGTTTTTAIHPTTNLPVTTTTTNWVNPNDGRAILETTTNVSCIEDLASPGNGTYRYRQDRYTGYTSTTLPTKIKASVTPVAPATVFNNGPEAILNRTKFP